MSITPEHAYDAELQGRLDELTSLDDLSQRFTNLDFLFLTVLTLGVAVASSILGWVL